MDLKRARSYIRIFFKKVECKKSVLFYSQTTYLHSDCCICDRYSQRHYILHTYNIVLCRYIENTSWAHSCKQYSNSICKHTRRALIMIVAKKANHLPINLQNNYLIIYFWIKISYLQYICSFHKFPNTISCFIFQVYKW